MSAAVTETNALTRQLWHIAGSGDLQQLDELMSQGADVNAGDRSGTTALMRAAYHGQLAMVRALIFYGADVNSADSGRLTALMIASHRGHDEIVETLLSCGAKGASAAKAIPRSVGSIADESVGEAPAAKPEAVNETLEYAHPDYLPKPDRTSRKRTLQRRLAERNDDFIEESDGASQQKILHEPLKDESNEYLAKPGGLSQERTVHEPLAEGNDDFIEESDGASQEEMLHEPLDDESADFIAKPDESSQEGTLHEPLDDESADFIAKPDESSQEGTLGESLDNEYDDFIAKPDEPSQEQTFDESFDDGDDDFLAQTDGPSHEGTLHAPPEIWELVHTTESEPGFAARVVTRVNVPRLLMLAGALIICAGVVFGLFYLRGEQTGPSTSDDRPPEAVAEKPTSLVRPVAVKTRTNETRRTNSQPHKPQDSTPAEAFMVDPPSAAVAQAIDDVIREQLTDASDRDTAVLTSPMRKPAEKTRNKAPSTRVQLVRADAHKTERSARSKHAEEEPTLRKEPKKLQAESASVPTKSSNAPKPKVIQWP